MQADACGSKVGRGGIPPMPGSAPAILHPIGFTPIYITGAVPIIEKKEFEMTEQLKALAEAVVNNKILENKNA